MRPQFHKILEETKLIGKHGKSLTRYVLRYNPKLFIQGACKGIDTEVFYPIKDTFTHEEENMIERMCIDCPIMMACLEWGIAHETYGVWGGTTPNKRKIIRNNLGWVANEPRI